MLLLPAAAAAANNLPDSQTEDKQLDPSGRVTDFTAAKLFFFFLPVSLPLILDPAWHISHLFLQSRQPAYNLFIRFRRSLPFLSSLHHRSRTYIRRRIPFPKDRTPLPYNFTNTLTTDRL